MNINSKLDIPIFHKAYQLLKQMDHYYEHIPKKKRYTLWKRCDELSIRLLEGVIKASSEKISPQRRLVLVDLDLILDQLRVFFRLCYETNCLNETQYLTLVSHLDEMGKMVGGWIKSIAR